MHPFHDYLIKQLAEKLKSKSVVVWYDARQEFAPFLAELRGAPAVPGLLASISVAGIAAHLADYTGSFFELRAIVEPRVSGDAPEPVIIYVPGFERDHLGSVLMELEKAGECYEPQLKRLARNVLRQRYTDGVIDELLAPEQVRYEDLARAASDTSSAEPPSILKGVFHDASGNDGVIAAWLASDARDVDIKAKEAVRELTKLIRSRLGLELPDAVALPKLRSIALRYVLAGEFRSDLRCEPPAALDSVPVPNTKDHEGAVRDLARRLRSDFALVYPEIADRVEAELGLRTAPINADALGSIDTFRFEERALLAHCGELIATQKFDEALNIIQEREHGFWLDRDVERKAQWEACRRMAELGTVTTSVRSALAKVGTDPNVWIDAYTAERGWYRMDQAQRRLEAWVANLDEEPAERSLAIVRRGYEDACYSMAKGFATALVKAKCPKPVAYFLVDAMRFEMGLELAERLPKTAEVVVRPAVGALPSITPIGMAAVQPGASASFNVVEQGGKLGALIDGSFLPDLPARKKFAAARIPALVDLALDELLSIQASRLAKKVEGARFVVVRSQEIDHAGEAGFTFQARKVMDTVIDNLARSIRKLAAAGIEYSVVTADHGHLFFASDRDDSMRTDAPGGHQVELHRRCWIGRGGATPAGCIRVAGTALGYDTDLELVFPPGCGIFRAGGDLAFHHGGPSLQELIIPVLTIRLKVREGQPSGEGPITATGLPDAVTNRIFSVTLQLGGPNLALFSNEVLVRPILMSGGKQVGAVGMAIDAEFDRETGCVKLQAGRPVTVAFLLSDEDAASIRVVVQDPATDAELYRSPRDISVRLGV
jgi:hypothetical protein